MSIIVEELPDNQQQKTSNVTEVAHDELGYLSIAKRFNIDAPTKQEEQMLREVYEHARSLSKIGDQSDIMWQIIHLEGVLGAPPVGSGRLERLYGYAKLKRQERQIQEELKNVELGRSLH